MLPASDCSKSLFMRYDASTDGASLGFSDTECSFSTCSSEGTPIVILTMGVPSLEQVEKEHSVSLNPKDAPSVEASYRINRDFEQSDAGSIVMVVLEGQQP